MPSDDQFGDEAYHQSTHVLRPRVHELPNGDLAVSSHWVHGVHGATTVPADSRHLYRVLMDILGDIHVPDLMPAHIATECRDLVAAQQVAADIERGRSDIGGVGYGMSYCRRARKAIESHLRNKDPVTLVAVGCSGSKHEDDEPLPAADRYRGGYWTNKSEYAEAVADDWRIISAEHGLLDPETKIAYYEKTPEDLEGRPVDAAGRLPSGDEVTTLLDLWALTVHESLAEWIEDAAGGADPRDVELQVLLGKKYQKRLEKHNVFDALRARRELTISFPFREEVDYSDGGGIGKQRNWLSERTAEVRAATDGGAADAE